MVALVGFGIGLVSFGRRRFSFGSSLVLVLVANTSYWFQHQLNEREDMHIAHQMQMRRTLLLSTEC